MGRGQQELVDEMREAKPREPLASPPDVWDPLGGDQLFPQVNRW